MTKPARGRVAVWVCAAGLIAAAVVAALVWRPHAAAQTAGGGGATSRTRAVAASVPPPPTIAGTRAVVCLDAAQPHAPGMAGGPLLMRELVRQGILIAAREDLGAATRDEALGEPFPSANGSAGSGGGRVPLVQLKLDVSGPDEVKASLATAAGELLWEGTISQKNWWDDCFDVIETADKLSHGPWLDALKKAGVPAAGRRAQPATGAAAAAATMPSETDERLGTLEMLTQFAAVRDLHRQIESSGPSPELLGALVRGYANLSQLTRFQWTAAHKVFAARALLYAQRMVDADGKSPLALWHRAYARALTGFHGAALADLDAAAANAGGTKPPAWVALLEPYCKFQTGKLVNLATQDQAVAPLGMFLAYLTVAYSPSQAGAMNLARAAGQVNKECLRLIDDMCDRTGPGMLNSLSEFGPSVFSATLGARLDTLPGVPEKVKQVVADSHRPGGVPRGRLAVIESLRDDSDADAGEPTWAALASLVRETTFVHIYRRANLIRNMWGVDASGYVRQMLPFIADHPYKNMVASLGPDPATQSPQIIELLHGIQVGDVPMKACPMVTLMDRIGMKADNGRPMWKVPFAHADATADDLEEMIYHYNDTSWESIEKPVRVLLEVSPHATPAMAALILHAWPEAQPHAAAWEAMHGDDPAVARALGKQYLQLKRWGDAERCVRKWIIAAPDQDSYFTLAALYDQQGRHADAIDALKEFCEKAEDYGLQHAQAQVRIAHYYMDKGDAQQAVRYADEAASTAAAWATQCAQEAHEMAREWDKAEAMVVERSHHYPGSEPQWFFWCCKTGRGDAAAARQLADDYARNYESAPAPDSLRDVANVHLLEGELEAARAMYRKAYDVSPDPALALYVALLSEQQKDPAGRDEMLKRAEEQCGNAVNAEGRRRGELYGLVKLARAAFATPNGQIDPAKIDELLDQTPDGEATNVRYFAAWFYRLRGKPDLAKRLLSETARKGRKEMFTTVLTWKDLRDMGVDAYALRYPPATQPTK